MNLAGPGVVLGLQALERTVRFYTQDSIKEGQQHANMDGDELLTKWATQPSLGSEPSESLPVAFPPLWERAGPSGMRVLIG